MNRIFLDCTGASTPRQLHDALAAALHFPAWYGHNLDALYDCLTAIRQDTAITLAGGEIPPSFRRVFRDAEMANPHLNITLTE